MLVMGNRNGSEPGAKSRLTFPLPECIIGARFQSQSTLRWLRSNEER